MHLVFFSMPVARKNLKECFIVTKAEIDIVIEKIHKFEAWTEEAKKEGDIREREVCSHTVDVLSNLLSEFGYGKELAESYKK